MYRIRDRQTITSGITKNVSKENWPFVIEVPFPPFVYGKVVALVTDGELAGRIVQLLNSDEKED